MIYMYSSKGLIWIESFDNWWRFSLFSSRWLILLRCWPNSVECERVTGFCLICIIVKIYWLLLVLPVDATITRQHWGHVVLKPDMHVSVLTTSTVWETITHHNAIHLYQDYVHNIVARRKKNFKYNHFAEQHRGKRKKKKRSNTFHSLKRQHCIYSKGKKLTCKL